MQCDFGPILKAHRFDFGWHHFDTLEFLMSRWTFTVSLASVFRHILSLIFGQL
jgi:hypothetical protein